MTENPRISVLVATYNGATLVGETLRAILAQDVAGVEIVVVDDGSSDGTRDVVAGIGDTRLRTFVTPRNLGPPGARNFAFAQCRGQYVAPVDQDDILLPNRLARQALYLDRHEDVVLVGTATERLVGQTRTASPEAARTSPGYLRWALLVGNPLVWSSVMIRKAAVDRLGVFNRTDRIFAEDFDLYHRLAAVGELARIDEVLTLYRSHPAGASRRNHAVMQQSAMSVLNDAYAMIAGAEATGCAELVIRHISDGEPVPDVATLRRLEALLLTLSRSLKGRAGVDEVARGLIAAHRAALMQRLVSVAIRYDTLSPVSLWRAGFLRAADLPARHLLRQSAIGWVRGPRDRQELRARAG